MLHEELRARRQFKRSKLMTSVNKAAEYFRNKQYAKCTKVLRREMSEIEITNDDSFTIQSLILENNIIVSEFLVRIDKFNCFVCFSLYVI